METIMPKLPTKLIVYRDYCAKFNFLKSNCYHKQKKNKAITMEWKPGVYHKRIPIN